MIEEQPLWAPGEDAIASSNLTRFMHFLARHYGAYMANSRDLHAFSVRVPEVFWPALWDFCGVRGDKGSPPYIIDGDKIPGARFFPDATLNFAENMLARPNQGAAIVFWSEDKVKRRMELGRVERPRLAAAAVFRRAGCRRRRPSPPAA